MTEAAYSPRWADIIADAIDALLDDYRQGRKDGLGFVERVSASDPALYYPRQVMEKNLSAAWNYADSFNDAAAHGFKDLDGIPWMEAESLLADTGQRLRAGRPIEDAHVLRYA